MLVRSGPTDFPRPRAVWQEAHWPLPKKKRSPAAASPSGWASKAVAFMERMNPASACN